MIIFDYNRLKYIFCIYKIYLNRQNILFKLLTTRVENINNLGLKGQDEKNNFFNAKHRFHAV